ncbi:MAG: type 1 glutamine amidotransferase [Candidatus Omnitrophica bacterium]|nr:type 1 glutamine amidotransferase [Candidatus Omnitrophota bacterium]
MASAPLILVVQHAEPEAMGLVEPLCRELGIAWHLCRPYAGEAVPPATQPYDGVVVLGGPMNVDETERYPFLAGEIKLLQQAYRRQLPTLGICLGAQLMAKAAGAAVTKGPSAEVGWFPIRLTDAGRQDPLLTGLPEELMTFHWHEDTYALPAKAVHLASSAQYPQQVFRLGPAAVALQCHVEVTPELVERWAGDTSSHDPAPLRAGIAQHGEAVAHTGRTVLTRFLQTVVAWHDAHTD